MGIQIETTIHGAQLGAALAANAEELAWALAEMKDNDPARLGREIADLGPYGSGPEIAAWLRKLADAIEQDQS